MRHANRRTRRRARASAIGLGLLARAVMAGADPAGAPLAAPGDCAQPRTPQGAQQAGEFEIAGSPRHHFTPGDVAVGPPGVPFAPPDAPTFTRGPCDAPNPGCRTILDRPPIGIDEPPVGTGPSPGGK
jgi:hypothetical protein